MTDLITNYEFNDVTVSNPDGSLPVTFTKSVVVQGPGDTPLGRFNQALDLQNSGKGSLNLTRVSPNAKQFCIRIVFQVNTQVRGRQNIVESNFLPFSLFADTGKSASTFSLVATVQTKAHGWSGIKTRQLKNLNLRRWYTVSIVYDMDTLGLFVNDNILTVHAFPRGAVKLAARGKLFFGTWVDGARNHFNGKLAAFQWHNGIPDQLESQLDEYRNRPEWFITYKYESIKGKIGVGVATRPVQYIADTGAYFQEYQHAGIMYHDSIGAAFEMHGAIYRRYRTMSNRSQLGHLVSDEEVATLSNGRKSVFQRGAIYWSSQTNAQPVLGQMFLDYENLGEARALGFPRQAEKRIVNGLEQIFQRCRMYYKHRDANAHEVHGAILTKFLSSGGIRKWGYPVTNEKDVIRNRRVVGKSSEFETCTLYWSSTTGAFEVHGDIRKKYMECGGPPGELGFPITDESDIPGRSGAGRINCFQKGSICWYGNYSSIRVARPFKVFIGRINSRESEGAFMGQNDMYCRIKLLDGGTVLYNKRHPRSGDWSGRNIKDVNFTIPKIIVPNKINKKILYSVDVWEADPGPDDHLGKYTNTLDASNAWGLTRNNGVFNSGSFRKIRYLTSSVKPQVNIASLSEPQKFWAVTNRKTNTISWQKHAAAFRDVDSETEWWDVTDWLDKAFYELVTKDLADSGNCFGMSLESIYARKCNSLFGMPTDRFKTWSALEREFNIKHLYQVGAPAIWWFLGQFISGNTHDPKDVFSTSRNEFSRGNNPILCITQNYDFSGKPHAILPVAWRATSTKWEITICDPNFPGTTKTLSVDPRNNTYEYKGSSTYRGGEWSGGRLHYMPFCRLDEPPRTPLWDAILLLLAGTIIIFADDAQTESITDANGNDLSGHGSRATNLLKSGRSLDEFFVGFKGFDQAAVRRPARVRNIRGSHVVPGEILLRSEQIFATGRDPGTASFAHLTIGSLLKDRHMRTLSNALRTQPKLKQQLENRTAHFVLNDPDIVRAMPASIRNDLQRVADANGTRNFIHRIKGIKNGALDYAVKHQLTEFKIATSLRSAEKHKIMVNDLGTSKNTVEMDSTTNKLAKLDMVNKLGVKRDKVRVRLERIPLGGGKKLHINLKPGLGGLEIIGSPQRVNLKVSIDAVVDGAAVTRRFTLPVEGGARVKLASALSDNELSFSKIDKLFGPSLGTGNIKGR